MDVIINIIITADKVNYAIPKENFSNIESEGDADAMLMKNNLIIIPTYNYEYF